MCFHLTAPPRLSLKKLATDCTAVASRRTKQTKG